MNSFDIHWYDSGGQYHLWKLAVPEDQTWVEIVRCANDKGLNARVIWRYLTTA